MLGPVQSVARNVRVSWFRAVESVMCGLHGRCSPGTATDVVRQPFEPDLNVRRITPLDGTTYGLEGVDLAFLDIKCHFYATSIFTAI